MRASDAAATVLRAYVAWMGVADQFERPGPRARRVMMLIGDMLQEEGMLDAASPDQLSDAGRALLRGGAS